jgi:hypothetical protein
MTSTGTVSDFSRRKVKITRRTINPSTEYKQFIIRQLPHGEISWSKAKKRVAFFGIFPIKSKFSDSWLIVKDSSNRAFYVKYYKNMPFLTSTML